MGCVYKATDLTNGKIYIGKTIRTLDERRKQHILDSKKKSAKRFQKAIYNHGKDNFKWESIFESDDESQLLDFEYSKILELKANNPKYGYNISPGRSVYVVADYLQEAKACNKLAKKIIDRLDVIGNPITPQMAKGNKWLMKEYWLWESAKIKLRQSISSRNKAIEELNSIDPCTPVKYRLTSGWCKNG